MIYILSSSHFKKEYKQLSFLLSEFMTPREQGLFKKPSA